MEALVAALQDPETRENALLDLSKKRDMFTDLAPILWHSFGVIPALLQEIMPSGGRRRTPSLPSPSVRGRNPFAVSLVQPSFAETKPTPSEFRDS